MDPFNILRGAAQDPGIPNPNIFTLSDIFGIVVNILMGVGFGFAIISIAYSGILYALSEGDPKATQQAWSAFIWGVIAAAFSIGGLAIKTALVGIPGVTSSEITNALPGL